MKRKVVFGCGVFAVLLLSALVYMFGPMTRRIVSDVRRATRDAEINRATIDVRALRYECDLYASEHDGRFPASLDELVPRYIERIDKDPWGNAYIYLLGTGGDPKSCVVRSNGPDGKAGTSDDIERAQADDIDAP